MKLKCIGGLCDDKWVWVEDYYMKEGEYIRVPKPIMALAIDFKSLKNVPDIGEVSYLIYKVATFCFKSGDYYYFLIPENWTNKEAVIHQFSK